MSLIIRDAKKEDAKDCVRLQISTKLGTADGKYWEPQWFIPYIEDKLFFIAEIKNEIVGFIMSERIKLNGAVLWFLAIDEKHQGLGIGKQLLSHFEEQANKSGITWIIGYSELTEKTLAFYKNNNFIMGKNYKEILKKL